MMVNDEYRPQKQLFRRPMPAWLQNLMSIEQFSIADVLKDSVYYPASDNDNLPIYAYAGFSHSFIYVDPHISRDPVLQKVRGFHLRFSREVYEDELCFMPYKLMLPTSDDGNLRKLAQMADLPKWAGNNGKPFAIWHVYERIESFNWGDPERISVLRITGEGIATYQALYFSNKTRPLLLFNHCCTCCTWSVFETRGGFFNRVVLANPAGHPDYLVSRRLNEEAIWNGYERRIEAKEFCPIWIADDLPLGQHYLHKPGASGFQRRW